MIDDWETSLAKHADWVRDKYADRNLSDDYIEFTVDEASYGFSSLVKIFQTLVVIAFFSWLGQLVEASIGAADDSYVGIIVASFCLPTAFFLWSKSLPLDKSLIRWSIRRRLGADKASE